MYIVPFLLLHYIMDLFGISSAGKYIHNLGLQASNLISCSNHALNSSLDTVATKMKDEGYATHLIGKKMKSPENTSTRIDNSV